MPSCTIPNIKLNQLEWLQGGASLQEAKCQKLFFERRTYDVILFIMWLWPGAIFHKIKKSGQACGAYLNMETICYVCLKQHLCPTIEAEDYWRIIIMEVQDDGIEQVADITHHNSEELADYWLREHWGIEFPPMEGLKRYFKSKGFRD